MSIFTKTATKTPLEQFNDRIRLECALMRSQHGCTRMQTDPHAELGLGPVINVKDETVTVPFAGTAQATFSGASRAVVLQRALDWFKGQEDDEIVIRTARNARTTFDTSALQAELDALTPPAIEDTPEVLARKAEVRTYAQRKVDRRDISRATVNKHLVNLGIEPLEGPKNFKFEVPVIPAPTATYTICANTEDEAHRLLQQTLDADRAKGGVKSGKTAGWVPANDAVGRVVSAVDVD